MSSSNEIAYRSLSKWYPVWHDHSQGICFRAHREPACETLTLLLLDD